MSTTEYNVTVELETAQSVDELADTLFPLLDEYSGAFHTSVDGRPAVTLTVHAAYVFDAVRETLTDVVKLGLTPYAVAVLPTVEFDRREGLTGPTVDVPVMVSVPQAAEQLNISEQRVRQLLSGPDPKLTGRKVGRDWLVSQSSVTARLGQ